MYAAMRSGQASQYLLPILPPCHPLQAPLAALHDGHLLCLSTSAGSTRLDMARSIDLLAARESVSFLAKMRPEVASAVKDLEGWVAKQQLGLDLGAHAESLGQSPDKLLKVGGCVANGHGWTGQQACGLVAMCASIENAHGMLRVACVRRRRV